MHLLSHVGNRGNTSLIKSQDCLCKHHSQGATIANRTETSRFYQKRVEVGMSVCRTPLCTETVGNDLVRWLKLALSTCK